MAFEDERGRYEVPTIGVVDFPTVGLTVHRYISGLRMINESVELLGRGTTRTGADDGDRTVEHRTAELVDAIQALVRSPNLCARTD